MSYQSELENSVNYISQNVNNRKLVFQHIAGIQKSDLEKKDFQRTRDLFKNQNVLEILENIYSNRFVVLCNETFSFLYQLSKFAIKSSVTELKYHILSLVPRLIAVYLHFTTFSSPKDGNDIDGLEILFKEIVKLDNDPENQAPNELDKSSFLNISSDFNNLVQGSAQNVYSKKTTKANLNFEEVSQTDAKFQQISKVLEVFISYLNHYNNSTEEAFFLLTELLSGTKVESKEWGFSSSPETMFGSNITLDSPEKAEIIKKCVSGLETLRALKPKHDAKITKCINNLSLKALSSGQFYTYAFCEKSRFCQLEDAFN